MSKHSELNRILSGSSFSLLSRWLPEGKKSGDSYIAKDPKTGDTIKMSLTKGIGKIFETDKGFNLISLYAYLYDIENKVAYDELTRDFNPSDANPTLHNKNKVLQPTLHNTNEPSTLISDINADDVNINVKRWSDEWTVLSPIPSDISLPQVLSFESSELKSEFQHAGHERSYVEVSDIYRYYNKKSELLFIICRVEGKYFVDGKKRILPRTWCQHITTGQQKWQAISYKGEFPLYNLHGLLSKPNSRVIVVEGEKCVDAITKLGLDIVAVTWCQSGYNRTDFSVLEKRDIVYWPDNDKAGNRKMTNLSAAYRGVELEINDDALLGLYNGREIQKIEGWDVADAIADGFDILSLIERFKIVRTENNTVRDKFQIIPIDMFLDVNLKTKKVKSTIDNLQILMKFYGYEIFYNVVSHTKECSVRGNIFKEENSYQSFLSDITSLCTRNNMATTNIDLFLKRISMLNRRNLVLEWIHSESWDGKDRFSLLVDSLVCGDSFDSDLKTEMLYRWMMSCYGSVARSESDYFRARGVLILQGRQRIGKSSFFEMLANKDKTFYKCISNFNPENRDDKSQVNRYWIVELGELESTLNDRYKSSSLKAFITATDDVFRRVYAADDSEICRRVRMCGTINKVEIFTDDENTRYWVIPVEKIDFDILNKLDMQQVWAQIAVRYTHEKHDINVCELSGDYYEKLNKSNIQFEQTSSINDLLHDKFNLNANKDEWIWRTYSEILSECGIPVQQQTQSLRARVGNVIRQMTGLADIEIQKKGTARKYLVPPYSKNEGAF